MANTGGTSTGLTGVPRGAGVADPALRRALQRLSGTNLIAKDGGVLIDGQGQLDINPPQAFAQLAAYAAANGLTGKI